MKMPLCILLITITFLSTPAFSREISREEFLKDNALYICSIINEAPKFDYGGKISPSAFITWTENKKKSFEKKITTLFKKHGDCVNAESPVKDFSQKITPFYLNLENGRRILFNLSIDKNGKITDVIILFSLPQKDYLQTNEHMVEMRDGIELRTIVFQKKNNFQSLPIVMERTPYFKFWNHFNYFYYASAEYYLERGYNYVIQSMRGMHGSEGEAKYMNPIDPSDASDTISWLREQKFSNGRIGIVGNSYNGYGAITAGIENPEGLDVIISGAGPVDSSSGTFNYNGSVSLIGLEYIYYLLTGKDFAFEGVVAQALNGRLKSELDIRKFDEAIYDKKIKEWKLFANAYKNLNDPYWKERSHLQALSKINIPTYFVAGLGMDGNMPDTVNNFLEIEANSLHKEKHHLILGNWTHGNNIPVDGSNLKPFMKERFDKILAYHLKDEYHPIIDEKRVQIASNYSEKFVARDTFPISGLNPIKLYLGANNKKNVLAESISNVSSSKYEYRPKDDSREKQSITFDFPIKQEIAFLGQVGIDAYVSINVPETEIGFFLSRTNKERKKKFLTHCTTSKRIKNTSKVIRVRLNHCPIIGKFFKGDILSLTITSNIYQARPGFSFARHPNVKPDQFFIHSQNAVVTVHHSDEFPSLITLKEERRQ